MKKKVFTQSTFSVLSAVDLYFSFVNPFTEKLMEESYVEKDENFYCEPCFGQKFMKVCATCQQPITDNEFLRVEDLTFHEDHFKCSKCEHVMKDDKYFHHHEGKLICSGCYAPHAITCDSCGKGILDYAVPLKEKNYHADCLKCGKCLKKITDQVVQHEKAFFHNDCYLQIVNPECSICHWFIDDNYLQIEEFVTTFYSLLTCTQKLHIYCYFKMRKVTRAAWRMIKNRKERLKAQANNKKESKRLAFGSGGGTAKIEKNLDEDSLEKINNQLYFKYEELVSNTPEGVDYRYKEAKMIGFFFDFEGFFKGNRLICQMRTSRRLLGTRKWGSTR